MLQQEKLQQGGSSLRRPWGQYLASVSGFEGAEQSCFKIRPYRYVAVGCTIRWRWRYRERTRPFVEARRIVQLLQRSPLYCGGRC
jgi:hypothetical protein